MFAFAVVLAKIDDRLIDREQSRGHGRPAAGSSDMAATSEPVGEVPTGGHANTGD